MKKLWYGSWIGLVLVVGLVVPVFCATLPNAKPGLYVNKDFHFSVTYPENWEGQKLLTPTEVLRVANPNEWKVPVLSVNVVDKLKGAELKDAAKGWIDGTKKGFPGSKRFKILSQEIITLEDGTKAAAFTIKYTWTDGVTKLQSGAVMAYKKDKVFTATVTTVLGGETTPDKLLEICRTLRFYK